MTDTTREAPASPEKRTARAATATAAAPMNDCDAGSGRSDSVRFLGTCKIQRHQYPQLLAVHNRLDRQGARLSPMSMRTTVA